MKIAFSFLVLVGLVASLFQGACSPAPTEAIELTCSNFFPPANLHSILPEQWIEEIEARTDGRVKIIYYPGGSLTPADKTYDGVVTGTTDIGMSVFAYTMGRFPVFTLPNMPHNYPNGWVATKVANDFYDKFKPAEVEDVHVLYLHASSPQAIFTTEKPVYKLEDLQGLVIRGTGVAAQLLDALGAEGYGASMSETYELLSKSTVDGSFSGVGVLEGWKQAEVVKYVTSSYGVGSTTVFFAVMNKDKWDSLPSDIQTVFTEVSKEMPEKHAMAWDYEDYMALEYFLSFEGREFIELSPEETARWVAAVQPVIDGYIAELTAKGLSGMEYHQYLLDRVSYWSKIAPPIEDSVSWVRDELEPLIPAK